MPFCRIVLVLLTMACLTAARGQAAPLTEGPEAQYQYRRIHVPADQPELWPTQGEALVPTDRDQVARLLRQAIPPAGAAQQAIVTRLELRSAVQGARLVGDGRATIQRRGGRNAFLPWPSAEMRIESPRWATGEEMAVLGGWGQFETPQQGLLVDRDAALLFEFASRDIREPGGQPAFLVESPPAVATMMALDLPPGVQPAVEGGLARIAEQGALSDWLDAAPSGDRVRWLVQPPPSGHWRLQLDEGDHEAERGSSDLHYARDTLCRIDESSMETVCRIKLRAQGQLPGAVPIEVPRGAVVTGIQQDGLPLEWGDQGERSERGVVWASLPTTHGQAAVTLVVRLLTPLSDDAPLVLSLPGIVGAVWSEGRLSVELVDPLILRDIPQTVGAVRLSAAADEPAQGVSGRLVWQVHRADPVITLLTGSAAGRFGAVVQRDVRLSPRQARSTVTIDFTPSSRTPLGKLAAPLQKGWKVTSVQDSPVGLLEDWEVVEENNSRDLTLSFTPRNRNSPSGAGKITVSLSRPLEDRQQHVNLDRLLALDLSALRLEQDELKLSPTGAYHLYVHGAPAETQLESGESRGGGIRFSFKDQPCSAALAGGTLSFEPFSDERLARSLVRVRRTETGWDYEAIITRVGGRPAGRRDMVRFAPPLSRNATVQLGDLPPQPVSQLAPHSPAADSSAIGMLTLPAEADEVCVIRFSASKSAPLVIPFPALEAIQQEGALLLQNAANGAASIAINGLTPARRGAETADPGDHLFDYDPVQVGSRGFSAVVAWRPAAAARASLRSLETRLVARGRVRHLARLAIHQRSKSLQLELPHGTSLLGVQSPSGEAIPYRRTGDSQAAATLEAHNPPSELVLIYGDQLQNWMSHAGVTPTPPLGVNLAGWKWRVVVPHRYSLSDNSAVLSNYQIPWRERLLGPLGVAEASSPLNPFSSESWRDTVSRAVSLSGLAATSDSAPQSPLQPTAPAGWRVFEFSLTSVPSTSIRVYDRSRRIGSTAAFSALVLLASLWLWPRMQRQAVLLVAGSGVAALLLPDPLAPWATAVWLGLLAGALLRPPLTALLRMRRRPIVSVTESMSTVGASLTLLLALTPAAWGEEQPGAPRPLEPILIPVDAEGQSVGDKWYLRSSFLQSLLEANQQRDLPTPAEWVLRSQKLRGGFQKEAVAEGFLPDGWSLQIDLWTMRRQTRVELPLHRGDADWAERALIDGIAAPIEWSAEGDSCSLLVSEPGLHQVVIGLAPLVEADEDGSIIRCRMPRCARSQLVLHASPGMVGLHSLGAPDRDRWNADASQLEVDLGGLDQAGVGWTQVGPVNNHAKPACDLMQWLTIERDEVRVAVRYVLEGQAPLPGSLRTPLPPGVDPAPPWSTGQTLELTPEEPWSPEAERAAYSAEWRLDRTSGLGSLSVPAVAPENAELRSSLLGVVCGEGLAIASPTPPDAVTLDATEFQERWGNPPVESAPSWIAFTSSPQNGWRLRVIPQMVEPRIVDQRLVVLLGRKATTLRLQVSARPVQWPTHRIEVAVPGGFRLSTASLGRGEESRRAEVTRLAPERLIVTIPETMATGDDFSITLAGSMPPLGDGNRPLPLLRVTGSQELPLRVEVRRHSDSLVELQEYAVEASEDSLRSTAGSGRVVSAFRLLPGQASPQVAVRTNEASFKVATLSRHRRVAGQVEQRVVASLEALSGKVDQVALSTQRGVTGLRLVSPADVTLVRRREEGPSQWMVVFPRSLTKGRRATLEFSVPTPENQSDYSAVLLGFPEASHWKSLVALRGDSPATGRWRIPQVLKTVREKLSPDIARHVDADWSTYRTIEPARARIVWAANDRRPPSCQLGLQDVRATVDSVAKVAMLSRFYVSPNGAAECRVSVPTGQSVVSVETNGVTALISQDSKTTWRVGLIDQQQPQVVSLLTVSGAPSATGEIELLRLLSPDAKVIRPSKLLVSMSGSDRFRLEVAGATTQMSIRTRDSACRKELTSLAAGATLPLSDWWKSRLGESLLATKATSVAPQGDTGELAPRAMTLAENVAQRDVPDRQAATLAGLGGLSEACAVADPGSFPTLRVEQRVSSAGMTRAGLALLILGAAVAYWADKRQTGLSGLSVAHRNAWLAVMGLVWWLWLPLGFLGLLLMVATAASEMRVRRSHTTLDHWPTPA